MSAKRVERLERALCGALRAGERQVDELIRLSQLNVRQKRAMWRAFHLIRQGKFDAAALVMETNLLSRDRKESVR